LWTTFQGVPPSIGMYKLSKISILRSRSLQLLVQYTLVGMNDRLLASVLKIIVLEQNVFNITL